MAEKYLIKKGYQILERNWTCHWGEIDLICRLGKCLIFVEVKFRSSAKFGYGYEAINYRKVKSLRRSAQFYLLENKFYQLRKRFEAIIISQQKGKFILRHYWLET